MGLVIPAAATCVPDGHALLRPRPAAHKYQTYLGGFGGFRRASGCQCLLCGPFGVWGLTSASFITIIMVLILTVLFFFTSPSSQSYDHIQHGHRCNCKFGYHYSLVSAAIVTPPVRLFDVAFSSSNSCIASLSCYYPTLPQSESHADVNKGNRMCASSAEETSSRSSKSSSRSESRFYHVNQPGMWLQRNSKANGGHGSGQPSERRCWTAWSQRSLAPASAVLVATLVRFRHKQSN